MVTEERPTLGQYCKLAPRASSMIFCLTFGVGVRQLATNSRSATQSRHSSESAWVDLSHNEIAKQLASIGTRVQFPPPRLFLNMRLVTTQGVRTRLTRIFHTKC
jgi:hypothetical protein